MADNIRRLLVLGGSRQAEEGLKDLQAKGFHLVVCDMDENAPGFQYAEDTIIASVYHIDDCLPAVKKFHSEKPIHGVMCLACDVPHIVARITDALGLPGNSIEVADRAVDKLVMKEKFSLDGVSVPRYQAVENFQDLGSFINEWGTLVVKPVDSRGSKGVSLLDCNGDTIWAFDYAKENSPTGRVMVEEYLSGPQVSTESIVIKGECVTVACSDRSYEYLEKYYPYIVENGGTMPSALPDSIIAEIKMLVASAAKSLGVTDGVVKGDVVVHDDKAYIIELAARLSGGYFCTHQIPFSTGVYLVEATARTALGETLKISDWNKVSNRPISTRWCMVDEGILESFTEPSVVRKQEGVLAFETWAEQGEFIMKPQNAGASVAMVQATGENYNQAVNNAEQALKKFNPVIKIQ